MYLTRMHLNPARRGTRHLLSSPQRMHAAVLASFPPGSVTETATSRVLWRVDVAGQVVTLYISSPSAPDLVHLVEQAGWPTSPQGWSTVSMEPVLERLTKGQEWMFRLTANPVRSQRVPGGRGKRFGHVTVVQQEEWLQSRGESWGVEVLTASVVDRRRLAFNRQSDGQARTVTLDVATFDGSLRVANPDALRSALTAGVGRGKGYGCGLLTLAPPR